MTTEIAWDNKQIAGYTVSFTLHYTEWVNILLVLAILGHPLAVLWWDFQQINPHWYLEGDEQ